MLLEVFLVFPLFEAADRLREMSWTYPTNLPTLMCSTGDKTGTLFRNNQFLALGVEETLSIDSSVMTLVCYLVGQVECFTNHFDIVHISI